VWFGSDGDGGADRAQDRRHATLGKLDVGLCYGQHYKLYVECSRSLDDSETQ